MKRRNAAFWLAVQSGLYCTPDFEDEAGDEETEPELEQGADEEEDEAEDEEAAAAAQVVLSDIMMVW